MNKLITKSEKETYQLAKNFVKQLKGGELIALIGDLGAGKTTFTKAIAKNLGIKENITSPTFVIMKEYEVKNLPASRHGKKVKLKKLIHIDAYRLKSEKDLEVIGAQEYFNQKDTITIIEWANKIKKILPKETIFINFKHKSENERIIEIN